MIGLIKQEVTDDGYQVGDKLQVGSYHSILANMVGTVTKITSTIILLQFDYEGITKSGVPFNKVLVDGEHISVIA